MIKLIDKGLSDNAKAKLVEYQNNVDSKAEFALRVAEAKVKFSSYNKKGNATFDEVKTQLTEMCCGSERCSYCEDSKADEVEHINPKDWYPEKCFEWQNYCYACGPCNGPKNNKFAIFKNSDGSYLELIRRRNAPVIPPIPGESVLINPRTENPLAFIYLDIKNTFFFVPLEEDKNTKDYIRSQYTIDILGLNSRSYLVKARRNAFGNFKARIKEYITERDKGTTDEQLNEMIKQIKGEHHQTVLHEMIRQKNSSNILKNLFDQAPEAEEWIIA